ncbi:MAG: hypothetical protein EA417_04795 [Gammaproteobacteria bacterium]|nr:MAG: hypothetical protein EA417_04795 [Gammaproteobacteria bacterium]
MARQNYGFEKRQRELKKNKKKEEKRQKKLERSGNAEAPDNEHDAPGDAQAPATDEQDTPS